MESENRVLTDELLRPVRSSFLTVLCVLTFIGSGYSIFAGITTMTNGVKMMVRTNPPQMDAEMEKAKRKKLEESKDPGSKFGLKMMDSAKDMMDENKIKQSGIATIIAALFTLTGAILMWRMNRKGFYLYVVGILAGVASPFVIYGTNSFLAMLSALFSGFFGLLFIVLYAFNLRDMKPKPLIS